MNSKNAKTATGCDRSGFLNTLNHLDGDITVCVFHNARNRSKNQRLCKCGAEIPRDEAILNNAKICAPCRAKESALTRVVESVITTPRRVFICKPCRSCGKHFTQQKLISDLTICENCLRAAQTESPAKRSKIISQVVKNYTLALQRQIFAGGVAR